VDVVSNPVTRLNFCDDDILIQLSCFSTLSIVLFLFRMHNVSETEFCLRLLPIFRRQRPDLSIGPNWASST
jgi:hypothetical protein